MLESRSTVSNSIEKDINQNIDKIMDEMTRSITACLKTSINKFPAVGKSFTNKNIKKALGEWIHFGKENPQSFLAFLKAIKSDHNIRGEQATKVSKAMQESHILIKKNRMKIYLDPTFVIDNITKFITNTSATQDEIISLFKNALIKKSDFKDSDKYLFSAEDLASHQSTDYSFEQIQSYKVLIAKAIHPLIHTNTKSTSLKKYYTLDAIKKVLPNWLNFSEKKRSQDFIYFVRSLGEEVLTKVKGRARQELRAIMINNDLLCEDQDHKVYINKSFIIDIVRKNASTITIEDDDLIKLLQLSEKKQVLSTNQKPSEFLADLDQLESTSFNLQNTIENCFNRTFGLEPENTHLTFESCLTAIAQAIFNIMNIGLNINIQAGFTLNNIKTALSKRWLTIDQKNATNFNSFMTALIPNITEFKGTRVNEACNIMINSKILIRDTPRTIYMNPAFIIKAVRNYAPNISASDDELLAFIQKKPQERSLLRSLTTSTTTSSQSRHSASTENLRIDQARKYRECIAEKLSQLISSEMCSKTGNKLTAIESIFTKDAIFHALTIWLDYNKENRQKFPAFLRAISESAEQKITNKRRKNLMKLMVQTNILNKFEKKYFINLQFFVNVVRKKFPDITDNDYQIASLITFTPLVTANDDVLESNQEAINPIFSDWCLNSSNNPIDMETSDNEQTVPSSLRAVTNESTSQQASKLVACKSTLFSKNNNSSSQTKASSVHCMQDYDNQEESTSDQYEI